MSPSSPAAGEARIFRWGAGLALLLVFASFSAWNYRSSDGRLGRTTPVWQTAIVEGTAPAPYVYRQGVPQLRRLFEQVLRPGHAAVAVDLLFAAIALGAGFSLGRRALGKSHDWTGGLVALLACAAVYPNDKAESVAMVALALVVAALAAERREGLAAGVAMVAIPFRPELSILFSVALGVAAIRHAGDRRTAAAAGYAAVAAAGSSYLLCARYLWWPDAGYPEATPAFMLLENLSDPKRYPGLALLLFVGAMGVVWSRQAWPREQAAKAPGGLGAEARRRQLGLGLAIVLWTLAILVLGKSDEIRLVMPVLPLFLICGLGRESR